MSYTCSETKETRNIEKTKFAICYRICLFHTLSIELYTAKSLLRQMKCSEHKMAAIKKRRNEIFTTDTFVFACAKCSETVMDIDLHQNIESRNRKRFVCILHAAIHCQQTTWIQIASARCYHSCQIFRFFFSAARSSLFSFTILHFSMGFCELCVYLLWIFT